MTDILPPDVPDEAISPDCLALDPPLSSDADDFRSIPSRCNGHVAIYRASFSDVQLFGTTKASSDDFIRGQNDRQWGLT